VQREALDGLWVEILDNLFQDNEPALDILIVSTLEIVNSSLDFELKAVRFVQGELRPQGLLHVDHAQAVHLVFVFLVVG